MVCENCGKKVVFGRSQHHRRGVAGKRWKKRTTATPRLFKPNVHWKTFTVRGEKVRMKLCTRCIKKFRKEGKFQFEFMQIEK